MGALGSLFAAFRLARLERQHLKPRERGRKTRLLFALHLKKIKAPRRVVDFALPAPRIERRPPRVIMVLKGGGHVGTISKIIDRLNRALTRKQVNTAVSELRRELEKIAGSKESLAQMLNEANYFAVHKHDIVLYK